MTLRPSLLTSSTVLYLSVLVTSCGGPTQAVISKKTRSHMGESFYTWRAQTLSMDVVTAKARDLKLPDGQGSPPETDRHMAQEAAAIWRDQCAPCHGVSGIPPKGLARKPRSWGTMGTRMGFTFGGDKMRAGIYRKIMSGVPPSMPAWRGQLSREQVWALVRHIEGFN